MTSKKIDPRKPKMIDELQKLQTLMLEKKHFVLAIYCDIFDDFEIKLINKKTKDHEYYRGENLKELLIRLLDKYS